jgi:hypothetical protein
MGYGPGSSVGIATGYGAGRSGDQIPVGARFFAHVQTGPGAHLPSYTIGIGFFPGVKRPGRDAEHTPPSKRRGHPLGLFRPVTGLLYLYLYFYMSLWSTTMKLTFCLMVVLSLSELWFFVSSY